MAPTSSTRFCSKLSSGKCSAQTRECFETFRRRKTFSFNFYHRGPIQVACAFVFNSNTRGLPGGGWGWEDVEASI